MKLSPMAGLTCLRCGNGEYPGYDKQGPDGRLLRRAELTLPCTACGHILPAYMAHRTFVLLVHARDREADNRKANPQSEIRWFVAVVDAREGDKEGGRRRPPPRTWGFFETLLDAKLYVYQHVALLTEGSYYTHAVIEPRTCGDGKGEGSFSESHWYKLTAQPDRFCTCGHTRSAHGSIAGHATHEGPCCYGHSTPEQLEALGRAPEPGNPCPCLTYTKDAATDLCEPCEKPEKYRNIVGFTLG